jgi:hypothetical protein
MFEHILNVDLWGDFVPKLPYFQGIFFLKLLDLDDRFY